MSEERLQILKMVESGKISAEEAAKLLEAVDAPAAPASRPKTLKVRVTEPGRRTNTISVSVGIADWLLRWIGSTFHVDVEGQRLDADQLRDAIKRGVAGKVADVEEDGRRVEVWLE